MKKLLQSLLIGSLCMVGANADYKLVLTDKDGVQTEQCIKSYSFSNNMESIAQHQGMVKDVYSEEETLTNKVWMGKPVYRKVVKHKLATGTSVYNINHFNGLNVENLKVVNYYIDREEWLTSASTIAGQNSAPWHIGIDISKDGTQLYGLVAYNSGSHLNWAIGRDVYIVTEYNKTTDSTISTSPKFKSYLHYVPSDSTTDEVITKNMDELGVQFLKNYTYDDSTTSCNKI